VEIMASDDPAALAASTAQGWAYALNTVARPAPEHLEAAQEALTALGRADQDVRWAGVADTLAEALTAARLRVDGGRPEITVVQLAEAVGQLRELGLVSDPVGAGLAMPTAATERLTERIAELEQELENAEERRQAVLETLARQRARSDQFERERDQERRDLKVAHEARAIDLDAAREDSRRAGYVWCLAQLGNSLPGYDDMSTEELRDLAAKRLREVNLDGGTLRHVTNELVRAGRHLALGLDGPLPKLDQERPIPLAAAVVELAEMTTRERATAVERQRELQEALEAERGAPGPSQTRWSDILRERDSLRHRVAELEATLKVAYGDDDITDPESP
jgi:hypothetical protein